LNVKSQNAIGVFANTLKGDNMKNNALRLLNSLINDKTTKGDLDIINYLKRLVRADLEPKNDIPKVDYMPYFEYLWKMYPRKVGKQNAIKQFEKKVRGLNEQEVKDISNGIYLIIKKRKSYWEEHETEICYIPHFASLLNSEVPNSKHYKGR
jgi:hypothetical protein